VATEILFKMSFTAEMSDYLEYEIEKGADDHDPRSCEGGHYYPGASFVCGRCTPQLSKDESETVLKD
jgi:hypothetical protein